MANTIKLKRGSGSDPGASDLSVGEIAIRTDEGKIFTKKDDGSVAEISGSGSGGTDFRYLALRNAANNGAASYPAADFTLVTSGTTNAYTVSAANALLVSYGGVLQQPNEGTSTPTTGFAISGTTIKFGSDIAAAPDFIIYQKGAGIGIPSDNSVDLAQLAHATQGDVLYYGASGVPARLAADNGKFLRSNGNSSNPSWETVTSTPEGTAILSTGESGASKYLREDGDGTCSWQSVPASGAALTGSTNNTITTVTGASAIQGEANLTFDGSTLAVTGNQTTTLAVQAQGIECPATVSASWTIGANNNAMFPGPMTVASGAVVTVPANSVLTIV